MSEHTPMSPADRPAVKRGTRRALALAGLVTTAALAGALLAAGSGDGTTSAGQKATAPKDTVVAPVVDGQPTGATGYRVPTGPENTDAVVVIYEDFACPYCAKLEEYAGENLDALAMDGTIRVEHQPIAILDYLSTNDYSTRAANAYAAVLHTSGEHAASYFRRLLFINQPKEGGAGLSDAHLIEIAGIAGADEKAVAPLIKNLTFKQWVVRSTKDANADGINNTPTVFVNDEQVQNPFDGNLPTIIDKAAGGGVL